MWRSRSFRIWDWLRSRRLVGEDQHHFFYAEFVASDKPERRYVEYKDRDITNSSDRMTIEWWSWLHNRRDSVPSDEEIMISALKKETLAKRVAVLEAEDEKQRLRQFSGAPIPNVREEEAQARRRKKVLLNLSRAAGPPNVNAGAVSATTPAHIYSDDTGKGTVGKDTKVGSVL